MNLKRRLIPSISSLIAFESVARTGSFTLAAQEQSLTQSAVSRQVRTLEDQLECALFTRSGRNVVLTEAGQAYVHEIRQGLQVIRDATLQVVTKRPDQVLNVAILPTLGTRWLMPRISRFVAKYPDITLNFTTKIGQFDFVAEDLDVAIIHGFPDWPNVQFTLLKKEMLVPVASPNFIKDNAVESAVDLARHQRLSLQSRPNAWESWFETHGIDVQNQAGMSFEHFSTLSQACIAGVGTALMPAFLIVPELERGDLVKVGSSVMNDSAYYVAQPKTQNANRAADLFRRWLLEEAQEPK